MQYSLLLFSTIGAALGATTSTSTRASTTTSTPYSCTKTTSLGTAATNTGVSSPPKPISTKGFQLGIRGLLSNDTTPGHYDALFAVVHDVLRPDDEFLAPPTFGHGAIGLWPNWPNPVFVQDPASGRLAIADAVTKEGQYWLSSSVGGANVSMRSTLAAGEAWIVCDPLQANKTISCRPSTVKSGKGYKWWSPPDTPDYYGCTSNYGPHDVSTQFATKQPANAGTNPDTNNGCPDYASYEVIAVPAAVPQPEQLYFMITKTDDYDTNAVYFTFSDKFWSIWSIINTGIASFDRSFYNGTRRLAMNNQDNTYSQGFATVDYSQGPTVFGSTTRTPTKAQRTLGCVIDEATTELKCSVDGKEYQWYVPDETNDDFDPILFGPCVRPQDKGGFNYTVARIYASEIYHFTTQVYTGYIYG